MKSKPQKPSRPQRFQIVLVTAPDRKVARKLATAALKARLVACANLLFDIESHYWWQSNLERSAEVLILFKTSTKCLVNLERLILSLHPYDTPEFVTVSINHGTRRYLDWLSESISGK